MNSDESTKNKRKLDFYLDRTAVIQVIMILVIIIVYSIFLFVQQFLYSFEGFRNKIIIINILLAVGLIIEIGHFVWIQYKKKRKQFEKIPIEKEENSKIQEN